MGTTTIRVTTNTHSKVTRLAKELNESLQSVIDKSVDCYRRKVFWERVNEGLAALQSDPDTWRDQMEERALWDSTYGDGLEGEQG